MSKSIITSWKGKMAFEWNVEGFNFTIDADESVGGEHKGPRPKPFMLAALGGCTGMDVISILQKMRITDDIEDFSVEVSGELTDEHPKYYKSMHVVYLFKAKQGKNLPEEKLKKAVNLSEERYCGVSALYKKADVKISSDIILK